LNLGASSFKAGFADRPNLAKSTDAKSGGTENNLAQLLLLDRHISFYLQIGIRGSVTDR
jgi:hypothetical protein